MNAYCEINPHHHVDGFLPYSRGINFSLLVLRRPVEQAELRIGGAPARPRPHLRRVPRVVPPGAAPPPACSHDPAEPQDSQDRRTEPHATPILPIHGRSRHGLGSAPVRRATAPQTPEWSSLTYNINPESCNLLSVCRHKLSPTLLLPWSPPIWFGPMRPCADARRTFPARRRRGIRAHAE
jgi:hypothetical protein